MKNRLIVAGGLSPEHEVSVVTGLQAYESVDKTVYNPIVVFVSEQGEFYELAALKSRKDYLRASRTKLHFGYDAQAQNSYYFTKNYSDRKTVYCVLNTLHGGKGESGHIAGMCESFNIPYTSTNVESSVLCMNKSLSKEVAARAGIPVIPGISFSAVEIKQDAKDVAQCAQKVTGLPAIIKPAHLGSSIGIKVAHTAIDLELGLLEASHMDSTILVEQFCTDIREYNCSVRTLNGEVIVSDIERPLPVDEILSFADKYANGAKKQTSSAGMASLQRELPARIDPERYELIQQYSQVLYRDMDCKGIVRIDYIEYNNTVYFNEMNPIPGSLAFYLWEVGGLPYRQLLSDLIEESVLYHNTTRGYNHVYHTDIIEKFVNA